MSHQTTLNQWVIFPEISFKTSELISILSMPPPSTVIYPHTIHELEKWDPCKAKDAHRDMPGVTQGQVRHWLPFPGCCYGTSPHGTTALKQALTDWAWHHWLKHKPFLQSCTYTTSAWMRSFWQFGKGRNWDHPCLLLKTTLFSWFETFIQNKLALPVRLHTPLGPGRFFFALMATQWATWLSLQQYSTAAHRLQDKGGGLCLPKVLQIWIYILRFTDTSTCRQVTYKQQQSELHLHLHTSVFSIMCDEQDLQVSKLLHPGHPNLLCYNVWEERTFQLFSHHYMKA